MGLESRTKMVQDLKPLELKCVIAIRDGLENGKIRTPHLLPPTLRPFILEMVLMHGTINRPNCLSTLSSIEFLEDSTCLDTQRGTVDDTRFLELVTETISKTIGEEIRELKLNVYGCPECKKSYGRKQTTMATVLQLIAKCPNLESLSLQAVTYMGKLERCKHDAIYEHVRGGEPEFLNDLASEIDSDECQAILKKLKHLRLIGPGFRPVFLRSGEPTIKFTNLSSLALTDCRIVAPAWAEFLIQVQNTLTSLILDRVRVKDEDDTEIFDMQAYVPMTLPQLEKLIVWGEAYLIDEDFVDDLIACSKLKQIQSMIDYKSKVQEEHLSKLSSWLSERESKIGLRYLDIDHDYRSAIDSESRFILVKTFGDMVTSFKLRPREWNRQLSTAFGHAMETCQKLESVEIDLSKINHRVEGVESTLLPFFDNEDRALQLRHLMLIGEFSHGLLASIFKNCQKLELLFVERCPQLNDAHLIEWASSYGGRLSWLKITECKNVTAEGILPVLVNSADRLQMFCHWERNRSLGYRLWYQLFNRCRFLQTVIGCPEEFEDLMKMLCNSKMHKVDFGIPVYKLKLLDDCLVSLDQQVRKRAKEKPRNAFLADVCNAALLTPSQLPQRCDEEKLHHSFL